MPREIVRAAPSPAQLAAWRALWRLLLAVPPTEAELAALASDQGEPPEAA
ncbi:MAG: hypothetical protein M1401_18670 [Chloroflexi bacterium]|nr:hypothetical protein [Chloroflexota bacterium]MCL5110844.1 hypothetical protein [Chloroflexota bacterium]